MELHRNRHHTSYLKNLRHDLANTLESLGCSEALVRRRGMIGIVTSEIDCDYYDFLAGKPGAEMSYGGEYMSQYSWAEYTNGELERLL